jgi:hypothetical protein
MQDGHAVSIGSFHLLHPGRGGFDIRNQEQNPSFGSKQKVKDLPVPMDPLLPGGSKEKKGPVGGILYVGPHGCQFGGPIFLLRQEARLRLRKQVCRNVG